MQASASGPFARIRLQAYLPGPMGQRNPDSDERFLDGGRNRLRRARLQLLSPPAKLILTAFNSQLCCANIAGAPVTIENPAVPGETISVYATGLGRLRDTGDFVAMIDGQPFKGSPANNVTDDGFLAGAWSEARQQNILFSGLKVGYVGIYQIDMELNSSLLTDPKTTLTVSQLYQTSNIVSIPVVATAPAN